MRTLLPQNRRYVPLHGNLRCSEPKALRLLDKQRALRALVAERLAHGSLLPSS